MAALVTVMTYLELSFPFTSRLHIHFFSILVSLFLSPPNDRPHVPAQFKFKLEIKIDIHYEAAAEQISLDNVSRYFAGGSG